MKRGEDYMKDLPSGDWLAVSNSIHEHAYNSIMLMCMPCCPTHYGRGQALHLSQLVLAAAGTM